MVKVNEGKDGKTGNRYQAIMMSIGYLYNCKEHSVKMWNLDMNRVIISRDEIWLKRMFYERGNNRESLQLVPKEANDEDEAFNAKAINDNDNDD